jgi:hypothetical protein
MIATKIVGLVSITLKHFRRGFRPSEPALSFYIVHYKRLLSNHLWDFFGPGFR